MCAGSMCACDSHDKRRRRYRKVFVSCEFRVGGRNSDDERAMARGSVGGRDVETGRQSDAEAEEGSDRGVSMETTTNGAVATARAKDQIQM